MNKCILRQSHWGNVEEEFELNSCLIYPCVCVHVWVYYVGELSSLCPWCSFFINNSRWVYEPLELPDSLAKQWLWMIRRLKEAGAEWKRSKHCKYGLSWLTAKSPSFDILWKKSPGSLCMVMYMSGKYPLLPNIPHAEECRIMCLHECDCR